MKRNSLGREKGGRKRCYNNFEDRTCKLRNTVIIYRTINGSPKLLTKGENEFGWAFEKDIYTYVFISILMLTN